tara:strand:+ start:14779 stop:15186 length:408 start_codon:yes stop_codon:yes gene_type:complete
MSLDPNKIKEYNDHFVNLNGEVFAGLHYLIDMWNVKYDENQKYIRNLLVRASEAGKATVLKVHTHHFGEGHGISGLAVLAESHISIHTWPERHYIAFDIFMCGNTDPDLSLNFLKNELKPEKIKVKIIKRGLVKT